MTTIAEIALEVAKTDDFSMARSVFPLLYTSSHCFDQICISVRMSVYLNLMLNGKVLPLEDFLSINSHLRC